MQWMKVTSLEEVVRFTSNRTVVEQDFKPTEEFYRSLDGSGDEAYVVFNDDTALLSIVFEGWAYSEHTWGENARVEYYIFTEISQR